MSDMIYRFRVILDCNEDIFRDIEIEYDASFEDLHNSIQQAFGFDGTQMASFYKSNDDWDQGEELPLFGMDGKQESMGDFAIHQKLSAKNERMLYVYDFLSMWTFFVEVMDLYDPESSVDYPHLVMSVGETPDEAPDKDWDSSSEKSSSGPKDIFDGDDSFDQFGYDEDDGSSYY